MDKSQAIDLQSKLLAIDKALRAASLTLVQFSQEDRQIFAGPLGELEACLHFEMLALVYARYPELRPAEDQEIPATDSNLRWADVTLPPSVLEADLDRIIFSLLGLHWQKTAMMIAKAVKAFNDLTLPVSAEVLGARILALAEADRIDSQGDLRQWRHSEVRSTRDATG